MLSERGVCVLDFGVAKVLASSAESTATHASTGSGQLVGTPRYMSPEQCLGQRVGARSDLYSLGVLLYEMLAGRPPFIDPLPSALLVKQATAPPPPLTKLREDIPRSLAVTIHALLAKRPEDRPRTAAEAKALLERSLVQSERIYSEIEPLSSTVAAAVNHGRSVFFRVGAPLVLVVMFGALLAWGYTGESASELRSETSSLPSIKSATVKMTPASFHSEPATTAAADATADITVDKKPRPSERLSIEQARRIAAIFSHGPVSVLQVVDTDSGPAIVAVHDGRKSGTTHFFVLEKRGGKYRVTARGPLDGEGFRRATWTSEVVDADEDGYGEVLFSGRDARESRGQRRLILFVPNDRRTYSMLLTGETTASGTPRIIWLSNAAGTDAAAYRTALRQKARSLMMVARNR